jgi:hypothetical protein
MMRCALAAIALAITIPVSAAETPWRTLEQGLEFAEFSSPKASTRGDSVIRVLRVDPERYELALLNASETAERRALTPEEWAGREKLLAVINAAMFQEDALSSVSLMRKSGHVNNPRLSKDRSVLLLDRRDGSEPRVKLLDRDCEDWDSWKGRYRTQVQSIRMVSCKGRNVWTQQPREHSTAAIAKDGEARVLLIHVASPYSTHDLIEILLDLPLGIERAMYLEGGAPAQLYVNAGGEEISLRGIPDSGRAGLSVSSPLPNVLGLRAR